jgi:ABC-type sugar transport system substrate-binding protein
MKRLAFGYCVAALIFSSAAMAGDEKTPRIAFLAGVVDATYTPAQKAGIEAGSGGEVTVFNPEFDPTKQLSQCQDAVVTGRYDAIVITALDNASSIPCVKIAKEAGIPLIVDGTAIGKDPNAIEPQVEGVVGSAIYRPETMGRYTFSQIEKACEGKDKCKIILEMSFLSDPLYLGAVDYIRAASAQKNIEIAAVYESQYDPAQTTAKLRDLMVANPDVSVIAFANDPTALAGIRVLKSLKMQDQVKSIAQGGTKAGAEAVKAGELYATLAVLPFTVSRLQGEMALKAIKGEPIAEPGLDSFAVGKIHGPITAENVDQFDPEW